MAAGTVPHVKDKLAGSAENLPDTSTPPNSFDIKNISNHGGMRLAGDYLQDIFDAIRDPFSYFSEHERERREHELQTRLVLATDAKMRLIREMGEDEPKSESPVKPGSQPRVKSSGSEQAASAPKSPIHASEKPAPHRSETKKSVHREGWAEETVGSSTYKATADAVEDIAGKRVRQFGGHVLRGEFKQVAGDMVEVVAGKDIRHLAGAAFNVAAHPIDSLATAASMVGANISSAKNYIAKLDFNPL